MLILYLIVSSQESKWKNQDKRNRTLNSLREIRDRETLKMAHTDFRELSHSSSGNFYKQQHFFVRKWAMIFELLSHLTSMIVVWWWSTRTEGGLLAGDCSLRYKTWPSLQRDHCARRPFSLWYWPSRSSTAFSHSFTYTLSTVVHTEEESRRR